MAAVRVEQERLRFEEERHYDELRRRDEEQRREEEERERREQEERERRDACRECEGGTGSHVCWSCEQRAAVLQDEHRRREQEALEAQQEAERLSQMCRHCEGGTGFHECYRCIERSRLQECWFCNSNESVRGPDEYGKYHCYATLCMHLENGYEPGAEGLRRPTLQSVPREL